MFTSASLAKLAALGLLVANSGVLGQNSTTTATPSSSMLLTTGGSGETLTVLSTTTYTVTSCAATVTDCPARLGHVVTEVVALYTTYCPYVNVEHTPLITAVIACYNDVCPEEGLTTTCFTQTQTLGCVGQWCPVPTIPMTSSCATYTTNGVATSTTLTVPCVTFPVVTPPPAAVYGCNGTCPKPATYTPTGPIPFISGASYVTFSVATGIMAIFAAMVAL